MKLNREYLAFVLSVILFIVGVAYASYVYLTWNDDGQQAPLVEVSLPVIEWQKYSNLSKQYEPVSIQNNK